MFPTANPENDATWMVVAVALIAVDSVVETVANSRKTKQKCRKR